MLVYHAIQIKFYSHHTLIFSWFLSSNSKYINKIYKHFMFYMIQMSYIFILNDPEASVEH